MPARFGLPDHLVAVSDSGNNGAFALIDARTGGRLGGGRLPLDTGAGQDLEGLSRSGDVYHAITSGGYLRHYRRTAATVFELAVPAYSIGDLACRNPRKSNCGLDFEGLCLADPLPSSGCAGFAAAKATGALVCLVVGPDGRLRADPDRTIQVLPRSTLAGCDIVPGAGSDVLYAGANLFGGNAIVRVHGWRDPSTARIEPLGGAGPGFAEAIAADPAGAIYRLSDSAAAVSAMGKYSCSAPGAE